MAAGVATSSSLCRTLGTGVTRDGSVGRSGKKEWSLRGRWEGREICESAVGLCWDRQEGKDGLYVLPGDASEVLATSPGVAAPFLYRFAKEDKGLL